MGRENGHDNIPTRLRATTMHAPTESKAAFTASTLNFWRSIETPKPKSCVANLLLDLSLQVASG